GKVTKMVPSTIPGTAKIILISCAESQGPSQPCKPNNKTKIRPEITGETEKGRSINVMRKLLPGNWNFAMAQAAAIPKIRFSGTAMAAAVKVSQIAAAASGSRTDSR